MRIVKASYNYAIDITTIVFLIYSLFSIFSYILFISFKKEYKFIIL